MKIEVIQDRGKIWTKEDVKRITIYNSSNDTETDKITIITGFTEEVPNGYFIDSFHFDDIDEIRISED